MTGNSAKHWSFAKSIIMEQTYQVHGMTCNGCRGHVEETLSKVKGV